MKGPGFDSRNPPRQSLCEGLGNFCRDARAAVAAAPRCAAPRAGSSPMSRPVPPTTPPDPQPAGQSRARASVRGNGAQRAAAVMSYGFACATPRAAGVVPPRLLAVARNAAPAGGRPHPAPAAPSSGRWAPPPREESAHGAHGRLTGYPS